MKLKILVTFTDKYSGMVYHAGDIEEFEDKRAKELLADDRKLVAKVKTEKKVATE